MADTPFIDLIKISEEQAVGLRSEEYAEIFYKLLYNVGAVDVEHNGDYIGISLYHKYKATSPDVYIDVMKLFIEIWPSLMRQADQLEDKRLDPTPFIQVCFDRYGKVGMEIAIEQVGAISKGMLLSPYSRTRYTEWANIEQLDSLFNNSASRPEKGTFIDQRYIDYLSNNSDQLGLIHWRKFEELTAEFFQRLGFNVELGPGSNDDGIDVRVWEDSQNINVTSPPLYIVQCKRQKNKVEKVVVKGLFADIKFQEANYGLIVTSSELSPGARKTIEGRGYPIGEVNKNNLNAWLKLLRTPGSGIMRV